MIFFRRGLLNAVTAVSVILGLNVLTVAAMAAEKKSQKGTRERIISREGRSKSGNSRTKINLEDAEIAGQRKTPMASMLAGSKAKKDFNMIPIRTDWQPEMTMSASSLDAGRIK